MDEISVSDRLSDQQATYDRAPYLTTYRALAACTRELGRFSDELVQLTGAYALAMATPVPVIRRPPGRCIIQLGPVALTAVWLRQTLDAVSTGELMVNVWQGSVSPRLHHRTERPADIRAPEPAVAVWERVLTAAGDTEATWMWHAAAADAPPLCSTDLARECIDQLGLAYVNHLSNPEPS